MRLNQAFRIVYYQTRKEDVKEEDVFLYLARFFWLV